MWTCLHLPWIRGCRASYARRAAGVARDEHDSRPDPIRCRVGGHHGKHSAGPAGARPRDRPLRRHDARDGGHRRLGHLHEPVRRGAAGRHAGAHPGRVGLRWPRRPRRGLRLRRAGVAAPRGGRAVRLPARGLQPAGRLPLRLGASARHAERRDGRGGRDLRPLPRRARAAAAARGGRGRPGPGHADRRQLPRRAGRERRPVAAHGAEDRRDPGAGGGRLRGLRRRARRAAAGARPAALPRPPGRLRRRPRARPLRLRRLADLRLRHGRAEAAGARHAPRAPPGRRRRRRAVPVRQRRLPARARRRRPRREHGPRLGRDAPRPRRARRPAHRGGHRHLHLRLPRPGHPDRPPVYYAMARDGVFFERVGRLDPRTRVPVLAIALQGAAAAVIALFRPVRADPELRGLGRLHRHGAHRGRSLRLPAARRDRELPGPWPPVDDRLLRAVVLARRGRHDPPLPGRQRDRAGHPRPRPARLPPVEGARGVPRALEHP